MAVNKVAKKIRTCFIYASPQNVWLMISALDGPNVGSPECGSRIHRRLLSDEEIVENISVIGVTSFCILREWSEHEHVHA